MSIAAPLGHFLFFVANKLLAMGANRALPWKRQGEALPRSAVTTRPPQVALLVVRRPVHVAHHGAALVAVACTIAAIATAAAHAAAMHRHVFPTVHVRAKGGHVGGMVLDTIATLAFRAIPTA